MKNSNDSIEKEYDDFREKLGLGPTVPAYKKRARCVYLSDESMTGLNVIARTFGLTFGGAPSVSALIEAIGNMSLLVIKRDVHNPISLKDANETKS